MNTRNFIKFVTLAMFSQNCLAAKTINPLYSELGIYNSITPLVVYVALDVANSFLTLGPVINLLILSTSYFVVRLLFVFNKDKLSLSLQYSALCMVELLSFFAIGYGANAGLNKLFGNTGIGKSIKNIISNNNIIEYSALYLSHALYFLTMKFILNVIVYYTKVWNDKYFDDLFDTTQAEENKGGTNPEPGATAKATGNPKAPAKAEPSSAKAKSKAVEKAAQAAGAKAATEVSKADTKATGSPKAVEKANGLTTLPQAKSNTGTPPVAKPVIQKEDKVPVKGAQGVESPKDKPDLPTPKGSPVALAPKSNEKDEVKKDEEDVVEIAQEKEIIGLELKDIRCTIEVSEDEIDSEDIHEIQPDAADQLISQLFKAIRENKLLDGDKIHVVLYPNQGQQVSRYYQFANQSGQFIEFQILKGNDEGQYIFEISKQINENEAELVRHTYTTYTDPIQFTEEDLIENVQAHNHKDVSQIKAEAGQKVVISPEVYLPL